MSYALTSSPILLTSHRTVICTTKGNRYRTLTWDACALPAISTLKWENNPRDERFLNFSAYYRNGEKYVIKTVHAERRVRFGDVTYGTADLYIGHAIWHTMTAKGETLRLCPYYDPVMRTLRFQYPNGLDSTEEKSLAELIARRGCQPLLRLAQAENLIDKVPATGLTSMDFDAVVQSGYYARAGLSIRPNLRNFQGSVRFKGEGTTTQMSWTPLSDDDRKYIDFFLYITPEDDRLRIWDMEAGRDLAVSVNMGALAKRGGGSSIGDNDRQTGTAAVVTTKRGRLALDSFHANEVKGRWPKIYKKIQNLGYWRDAESQGKATA